jgi:polyhydroxyalkanoate synthesis regulator phasin
MALANYQDYFQRIKQYGELYKKFTNLAVDDVILPQGDGTIRISPFDDYILFTIYEERNGSDTPIDFLSAGSIFLSFIGENDEIKIPYYTNVKQMDLSAGQVLFRISAEDSKKILALDNNNFYVSVQMQAEGENASDESVIYTGKFLSFADEAQQSLTDKYDLLLKASIEEGVEHQAQISERDKEIAQLKQTITDLENRNQVLFDNNITISNELADLAKDLSSDVIDAALQASAAAQQAGAAAQKASVDIQASSATIAASNAVNFSSMSNECKTEALERYY